jgi:putative tricarboxylic transport membrane protein
MWHDILVGVTNNLTLTHVFVVLAGTVVGLIIGALPGLSAASGVALMLPFTFTMDPAQGLIMLAAVYMSAEYGGSISAILINTPGTPGAACTTLDGTPLTRKGQAQEALYISLIGGTIGGLFGVLVLLFLTKPLAQASLLLGPSEIFWIAASGLGLVATLSGENVLKGLFGATLGLALTMVGQDSVTGDMRFTYETYQLVVGIPLVPALLGLFAVASILSMLEQPDASVAPLIVRRGVLREVCARLMKMKFLLAWTSVLGTAIGIIPGAGASIAAFAAYGVAKRVSKHPEEFGKGSWEGIAAPETANNSVVGGALVPLLALGIPGSGSAAIMFGALAVHGIIPGPKLFTERGELAYTFMIGLVSTVFAMLLVGLLTIRWSSLIVKTPQAMMIPAVLVLSVIGVYGLSNSQYEVYVLVVVGIFAYFLDKLGVPLVTIALGLVLGRLMEESFQLSSLVGGVTTGSTFSYFLSRPLTVALMLLALAICVGALLDAVRGARAGSTPAPAAAPAVGTHAGGGMTPFVGALILAAVAAGSAILCFVEAQRLSARAGEFPVLLGSSFAILGAMLAIRAFRTRGEAHENLFVGIPWRHILPVTVLFMVLALSVGRIGFYESAALFAGVVYWLLTPGQPGDGSGLLRAARAAGFAITLVAAVYVAFRLALDIPTPAGFLL